MVKISVVAPVYGVEQYIGQFLDSLRNQSFADFEAILVDDGSKDACPDILDEFAKEDPRYRVIHQENGGVSKARNVGLSAAEGEYVYIVDSDDWLEPKALEVLWAKAGESHADIIYGDWISERGSKSVRQYCFPHEFETENQKTLKLLQFAVNNNNNKLFLKADEFDFIEHLGGAPWRGMVRTAVIKQNNLSFDSYVKGLGDDILFMLHLYEYVNKVAYVPKVIYHYRSVAMSYSHGFKADYPEACRRIYEKQEEFLNKYHKDSLGWQAYYMRVLIYLQQGMRRYFLNDGNPKTNNDRFVEFKELISEEPYRTAAKEAPINLWGSKNLKYTGYMLRYRMLRLYWLCQKYSAFKNNRIENKKSG